MPAFNDGQGFDAHNVKPSAPRVPLPAGEYRCVIVGSESKPTKAGTGSYLQLTLEVTDGPHQGRKLFDRLNLNNPNQQAVQFAQQTLSAICHAVGVMNPAASEELHDIEMVAAVGLKKDNQGGLQNEVKGYKSVEGGTAPAKPTGAAPKPAPQPTGAGPQKWRQAAGASA